MDLTVLLRLTRRGRPDDCGRFNARSGHRIADCVASYRLLQSSMFAQRSKSCERFYDLWYPTWPETDAAEALKTLNNLHTGCLLPMNSTMQAAV